MNGWLRKFVTRARTAANPLVIQSAGVVVGTAVVAGLGVYALRVVHEGAQRESDLAHAQFLAGTASAASNDALWALNEGRIESTIDPRIAPDNYSWTVTGTTAVAVSDYLRVAGEAAIELEQLVERPESEAMLAASIEARAALEKFLRSERFGDYRLLEERTTTLRGHAVSLRPVLEGMVIEETKMQRQAAFRGGASMLVVSVLVAILMAFTTGTVSRRLRSALAEANTEKAMLTETTLRMERRNAQLQALYLVISEVSETLSLHYVVETTLREARKLVSADVVDLRLLKDDRLEVAGTSQDVDADVAGLRILPLGNGIVGRAAKRGRPVRLNDGAEAQMVPEEYILGMESGLVLPLIVGARVVGTLSCWSRRPHLFSEDDEQVLSMMASQVATAVIAASTHEASEHDAHHDALTGLPNRRQLARDLDESIGPALEHEQPVAFAMLDIDHFKRFNDEFGHKVGDITLQKVAEVLRAAVRAVDRVYRYGGEEFVVVLAGASRSDAEAVMERVRTAVARTPLTGEALQPVGPVTVSIGVALAPEQGTDSDLLLKLADDALYQSKWTGRNCVTIYSEPASMEIAA